MLNILVPLAGASNFFGSSEYQYPKPLIEILGKPMIELVVENLNMIRGEKNFIFIVNEEDCDKFHLDNIIRLLESSAKIIKTNGKTQGAVCSCLLAIEHINNKDELIIVNADQILNVDYNDVFKDFRNNKLDAAVIVFESVHPKWSYVLLDERNKIIETTEKNPISKNAIAGFYYFKHGQDFINAAFLTIEKENTVDGLYYVAPTFNELVLQNKNLGTFRIESVQYHSFYSPQKIEEYETIKKIKTNGS